MSIVGIPSVDVDVACESATGSLVGCLASSDDAVMTCYGVDSLMCHARYCALVGCDGLVDSVLVAMTVTVKKFGVNVVDTIGVTAECSEVSKGMTTLDVTVAEAICDHGVMVMEKVC